MPVLQSSSLQQVFNLRCCESIVTWTRSLDLLNALLEAELMHRDTAPRLCPYIPLTRCCEICEAAAQPDQKSYRSPIRMAGCGSSSLACSRPDLLYHVAMSPQGDALDVWPTHKNAFMHFHAKAGNWQQNCALRCWDDTSWH